METDFFSRHRASQRRDFVGEAVTVLRESLLNVQNSGAAQNHDPSGQTAQTYVPAWQAGLFLEVSSCCLSSLMI